jgi:hypothetical protein
LSALSHLPFTDEGIRSPRCSVKGQAKTRDAFARLTECVFRERLFVESIPEDRPEYFEDWKETSLTDVRPKRFRKRLAAFAREDVIVTGSLSGDGITCLLAVAVRSDGMVDAVLADADVLE